MASAAASRPATPTTPAAGCGWPAEKETDVVYASYDPLGNAHQRVDGPNDVRFSFDRAGRLTQVEEALSGGGTRPLKSYTFGVISTASNWANGKVVEAIGNNHLPLAPGSTEDQRFIETFTYGGVGGRVSHRRVQWSSACDGGPGCSGGYLDEVAFEHGETYSPLEARATVTYPECDTGKASCAGQWPCTVTSTYTKGYLTGVTGWATSIGYHRNQTVDQVEAGGTPAPTSGNTTTAGSGCGGCGCGSGPDAWRWAPSRWGWSCGGGAGNGGGDTS